MVFKLQNNRVRRTYLGGRRIDEFVGSVAVRDGALRPEDWLASTVVAYNGSVEVEGEGLGRLADGALVKDVIGDLPILVKLLDCDERLVIQAHPTVPFAKARMNSPVGKTECWYFLPGTAPDACVYLGFKPGVTREQWRRAFETQTGLLERLHRIPVRAGDFVFVDGGVPHAIGGGCFMIELQEPSDLMVVAERVTPSGRRIPEGKIFCGLDLEDMLDVYDYQGRTVEDLCAKYVRRNIKENGPVACVLGPELTDKFSMWRLSGGATLSLEGAPAVAVVTEGEGSSDGLPVVKGDRLVVADEPEFAVSGDVELVLCK